MLLLLRNWRLGRRRWGRHRNFDVDEYGGLAMKRLPHKLIPYPEVEDVDTNALSDAGQDVHGGFRVPKSLGFEDLGDAHDLV